MLVIRTLDELVRHVVDRRAKAEHRRELGGEIGTQAAAEVFAYDRVLEAVRAYRVHGCDLRPADPDFSGVGGRNGKLG